eukprot:scaffold1505_cov390-Prasinococcus_capsulatus_cf.AAC.7
MKATHEGLLLQVIAEVEESKLGILPRGIETCIPKWSGRAPDLVWIAGVPSPQACHDLHDEALLTAP